MRRPVVVIGIIAGGVVAGSAALGAAPGTGERAGIRPDAAMLQYPDVSASQIVFLYANDLWLAPREGGEARPLAAPAGREMFPKFSPDGATVAYVGNYEGNRDVYTIKTQGGLSVRCTHHPANEVVTDWTPDGRVLFYAAGQAGLARQDQLFTVSPEGGMPEKLPVPYGTTGTISPDGVWLAYTTHTHDFRTWKRYRGGWATDIWLFNLKDRTSKRVTDWEGTDTAPMWQPNRSGVLFYLSDEGESHRANIWSLDTASGKREQVTTFDAYDVKWPSIGPGPSGKGEIIFQNGPDLYLLDLASKKTRVVEVIIPGDVPSLREQQIDYSKNILSSDLSPSGKRVAVSARGDLWSLPAVEGVTERLSQTAGEAERDPLFSPDGKRLAYVSDASGEYELYVRTLEPGAAPVRLTTDGAQFRFLRSWSPDSKRLLFTDKTSTYFLHTLGGAGSDGSAPGVTKKIVQDPQGGDASASWSHDSGWVALTIGHENTHSTIWLYEIATGALTQMTSEMFDSTSPAFDRKGDWLYFATSRTFTPTYSSIDSSFVYRNTDLLMAVPLRADVKNPLAPKNDSEKKDEAAKADEAPAFVGTWAGTSTESTGATVELTLVLTKGEAGTVSGTAQVGGQSFPLQSGSWDKAASTLKLEVVADATYALTLKVSGSDLSGDWTADGGRTGTFSGKKRPEAMKIALGEPGDLERRAIQVPVAAGALGALSVNESGKLLYTRNTNAGVGGGPSRPDLKLFDFLDAGNDKNEEKTVASGIDGYSVSGDGKKLLITKDSAMYVVDAAADQKLEKKVPTGELRGSINPREEWRQILKEVWRLHRDYFYVPGMHGVDWAAIGERYGAMIDHCASRDDVTFVIGEMISELNVGHAYYRPGDTDTGPDAVGVGLLGADFELATSGGASAYRIKRLYEGGAWDADARNPLRALGVDVKEGQYLLAVNGTPIDTTRDIWAAFVGLAGKTVSLTFSDSPTIDDAARTVLVKTLSSETDLRFRAWIEDNRRYADYKSGGKVGYIYVVNTGQPGQNDLFRQFYGQRHKAALIIDDRWNGGGQIPTRFIELLNRPRTNYWARRDSLDWAWPRDSHQGPKAMLINGLSASGGDMFPALFRQVGLGKLFGTRTWGGLVGISGNPVCIDGTMTNVPTFGYYQNDGTWGIEGHGVDPDVEVLDDPAKMPQGLTAGPEIPAMGGDPQLDAAIDHLLQEIQVRGYTPATRPAEPDRSGMGIKPEDK